MKKTVITTSQIMADLLAEYDYLPLLPNDITAARLAARSIHKAEFWVRKLDDMVRRGELIKLKCINPDTHRPNNTYRPKAKA